MLLFFKVPGLVNCISITWDVYSVQIPRFTIILYPGLQFVISKIPGDSYIDKVREPLDYVVTPIHSTLKLVINHRIRGKETLTKKLIIKIQYRRSRDEIEKKERTPWRHCIVHGSRQSHESYCRSAWKSIPSSIVALGSGKEFTFLLLSHPLCKKPVKYTPRNLN